MHKTDDITLDSICKIEGHASLDVKVLNGEVKNVKLKVVENMRFFKEAVLGKKFSSVQSLVSRICGTCSTAHFMGAIECIEHTFNAGVSEQSLMLKHLVMNSMQIRDHAMHLFFFCLPDLFNKDSILDFKSDSEKSLLHDALHVKEVGNAMGRKIAGRSVHPLHPTVGGFSKLPSNDDIKSLIRMIKSERDKAVQFVDLFYDWDKVLERDTNYIATHMGDDYNFLEGNIYDSKGVCIPDFAFTNYLNKVVVPYSQAEGFLYGGETYMVGALARMNINKGNLHKYTRRDLSKHISRFPSKNAYDNNLAQAIEIVHAMDHSLEILERLELRNEPVQEIKPVAAGGTGIVEAPRGTLYYYMEFGGEGVVDKIEIVIPTAQNQIMIEKDCGLLVQNCLNADMDKDEIKRELEILIRAYDPCMSCATHFLEVNWK